MPKDKDRTLNPATAQLKSDKAKALKKGKAAVAAQRTERYASRNPNRLESTIESLQALKESQGGKLGSREQKQLQDAELDLGRVRKAREALGERAGRGGGRGRGGGGYGGLGKRARDAGSSGSDTDESVRRIPWPRDTPPPLPRQNQNQGPSRSRNANREPLGAGRRFAGRVGTDWKEGEGGEIVPDAGLPGKPGPARQVVYESKAQVRDLRKEATERFVPVAVRRKIDASKGKGGKLLEEEEVEALEREGYGGVGGVVDDAAPPVGEEVGGVDESERERRSLEEEEERFRREMEMEMEMEMETGEAGEEEGERKEGEGRQGPRGVELEEVVDEDL